MERQRGKKGGRQHRLGFIWDLRLEPEKPQRPPGAIMVPFLMGQSGLGGIVGEKKAGIWAACARVCGIGLLGLSSHVIHIIWKGSYDVWPPECAVQNQCSDVTHSCLKKGSCCSLVINQLS